MKLHTSVSVWETTEFVHGIRRYFLRKSENRTSDFKKWSGMTSLYTLMGLSIERWLIITRPGKFSLNSSTSTAVILVSAWTLGLASSAPPLFGWAYYAPETSGMRLEIKKFPPPMW
jgi:hypothetical protein